MDQLEQRTATLARGVTLPYAEAGRVGGSVPVVLVHAYVESWRYFEPLLRALPTSVRAFAPTSHGGRSVGGGPVGHGVGDLASDLVGFMDAVGVARAVLVGASSGGLVAQRVATSAPQRVAGLVLLSSPVTLADKPGVAAVREQVMTLSDPLDRRLVERFVRDTSPDGVPAELVARLVDESLAIPAAVWREAFLGLLRAERPEALEDIHVPTLLLSGATDAFVRDDQQILLQRIPDVEVLVYDGVGHSPHLAHPERVAADLAAFVHGPRIAAAP